ncbi:MAG: hypothetical protein ACXWUG_17995 [Polyangiales bacterium]
MNEPKRILDEDGGLARALLSSAEHDAPPPGSRGKAMAALGIAGGATVATTAKAATAAKLVSLKWIGIALLPVAIGTTYLATRPSTSPSPSPGTSPSTSPSTSTSTSTSTSSSLEVEAPMTSSAPVEVAPIVSTPPSPTPKIAPVTKGADEAALIDAAVRAIKAGDKKTALAKLDEYDRRFKGGILESSARDLRAKAAKLP